MASDHTPFSNTPHNNNINCLQINACHSYTSIQEILQYSIRNNIHIILVSEPYVTSHGNPVSLSPFTLIHHRQFTNSSPIKAAIYYNLNHIAKPYYVHSNQNIIILDLEINNNKKYRIVSIYIPPKISKLETSTFISQIQNAIITSPTQNIIIGGDFNAHHQSWDDHTKTNHIGEKIIELIASNNLALANKPNINTFNVPQRNAKSVIDLTLHSLTVQIKNWNVLQNVSQTTDHHGIIYTIQNFHTTDKKHIHPNKLKSTYKFDTNNINWNNFTTTLKNNLEAELSPHTFMNITDTATLEEKIIDLTNNITQTCKTFIPRKSNITEKHIMCQWWTEEHTRLKNETNRLKHKYQNYKKKHHGENDENAQGLLDQYIACKNSYKKALSTASTNNFREYLETFHNIGDTKKLKNLIAKLSNPIEQNFNLNNSYCFENKTTSTPEETMQMFLEHFYPNEGTPNLTQNNGIIHRDDNIYINKGEIFNAANTFNSRKAPGIDGITADIAQHIIESSPEISLSLNNKRP